MTELQAAAERIRVGEIYRTPFEPSGLVKVLLIEPPIRWHPETAFVEFVGDHPKGYKSGTHGRYPTKELRALTEKGAG